MNAAPHIIIYDPEYTIPAKVYRLNKFFTGLLNDKRDLPFIHLSILICVTTVPAAAVLFVPGMFSWWLALSYFLINAIFLMGPYILMLHNVSHRVMFKRKYSLLNKIIPWIMGPFFGVTPETYFAHHIGMHHKENNMEDDLSCTLQSQRDSLRDFMKYFLRFFFCGIPEMYSYLKKRKRSKILFKMLFGEFCFIFISVGLLLFNWKASVAVFVFPLIFTRFMMMAGNWAQHAFIDKEAPGNFYRNSITCINSAYNRKCWNDGYHIGHHIHPSLHWTDMPSQFRNNIEIYKRENAVVFRKADYFMIWLLLMTKSYKALAKIYVNLDERNPKSEAEIITLLKSRTGKFGI